MIDPRENLKAYLDHELKPVEAEAVRLALQKDAQLAAEAEKFLAISAALRQEQPVVVHGLDAALTALRENETKPRTNLILVWGGAAATLAAVVAFVAWGPLFKPAQSESSALVATSFKAAQAQTYAASPRAKASTRLARPEAPMPAASQPPLSNQTLSGANDPGKLSRVERPRTVEGALFRSNDYAKAKDVAGDGASGKPADIGGLALDVVARLRRAGATVTEQAGVLTVTADLEKEAGLRKFWAPFAKQDRREVLPGGRVRLTLKILGKP